MNSTSLIARCRGAGFGRFIPASGFSGSTPSSFAHEKTRKAVTRALWAVDCPHTFGSLPWYRASTVPASSSAFRLAFSRSTRAGSIMVLIHFVTWYGLMSRAGTVPQCSAKSWP